MRLPSPAVVGITLPGATVDPPASCGASATTTFPVNQDLAIAWTNGLPGSSVGVTLTVQDHSDPCAESHVVTKAVSCTFPGGTGAATIPAVGLSRLAVAGAPASGAMTFNNMATQYQTDGSAVLFGSILDLMRTKAATKMGDIELVDGAGHWIQQEQPARLGALLLAFGKEVGGSARGSG